MIIKYIQMTDNQIEKIERLRVVMQEKNILQKDMATLIGVKASNLSAILKGRENRELPYGTSYILQVELGVNRFWFDSGTGDKFIPVEKLAEKQDPIKDILIQELRDRVDELKMDKQRLQARLDTYEHGSSKTA